MKPWSRELVGKLDQLELDSRVLADNPLGDPARRPLWVYLPPEYDSRPEARFASIYLIQGMTGQLDMWNNRLPFRPTVPELVDELFADGNVPPCLIVFVDCWTSYGGSQFLDSPGTGRYHTFLCDEVVPFVDGRYRTKASARHRGITGKSSGGYGAMVTPLLRPDLFGGLATHCGDALFEVCYQPEFAAAARALRDEYDGTFESFWDDLKRRPALSRDSDAILINTAAMAACYSANDDGSIELPFDPRTGELRDDVWQRWLERDPVRMARRAPEVVRDLAAIYIDAGKRDEYFLDLGATAFRDAVTAAAPEREPFFELFDATHKAIEYRYPKAIAYLAERLA